jgi:NADPH:quinone reductase-like Zn-dependent oxidoreductase
LVPAGQDDSRTLVWAEVDDPEPRPDELVVSVAAFSVNRGETFLLENPKPGWRPGKDVAGVVTRAADTGYGPPVGTRVVAHPESGGWAESVAVTTSRVAALPDAISFEVAAALPLAGLTALRLSRTIGSMTSRRILLTGASGGVGHYFVELVAAQGAEVCAVSASHDRGERLRTFGATDVIERVADAKGPFDIGLDSIGGSSTAAVLRKLHDHGLLIWFGQASRVAPTLDFLNWSGGSSATIRKFSYTDSTICDGDDLATLVHLVAMGRLHPEIGMSAAWSETNDVIRALVARRVRGNAVLTLRAA